MSNFESSVEEIVSVDPAIGVEIGRVPVKGPEAVDEAVKRSRAAFDAWKRTSFARRRKFIFAAREVMLAELDDIARLVSQENGQPFGEAIAM